MNMLYRHRQTGWFMLIGLGLTIAALLVLSIFLATRVSVLVAFIIFLSALAMAVLLILFSSMTVEVTNDKLNWYFGPRFWRNTISLADITHVAPIRTKWYWGYGIKFFGPDCWLYNVSGLEAVEIRREGGWVRIGTDDAGGLVKALTAALLTRTRETA